MSRSQEVSTDSEQILHDTVNRREPLELSGRLETPHLALTLSGRLMGGLRAVIRVLIRCSEAPTASPGVGAGLHGFGLSEDADPLASSTAAGAQFPRELEGAPEVQDEISRRKLARVRTSPRGARRRDTLALRRRDGRVETCAVWSAGRAEEILGPRDRDRIDAPARLPVALAPDRGLLAVGPGLDAHQSECGRTPPARGHHKEGPSP